MKIGDKIICKCEDYYGDIKNPVYILSKGKTYIITHIHEDYLGLWVKVEHNRHPFIGFLFKKYFYTEKELRRKKLNKINVI